MTIRFTAQPTPWRRSTWLAAIMSALWFVGLAPAQEPSAPEAEQPPASAAETASESSEEGAEVEASSDMPTMPDISLPDLTDLLPDDWPAAQKPAIPPAPRTPPLGDAMPDDASAPQPPAAGGRLPWEPAPAEKRDEPILRPLEGPLEILERFDIGPSRLEYFYNGQAWTPSEEETLVRILYRFPRLGLDNLMRWRQKNVSWDEVVAGPWNYRGKVFRLQGRVKQVSRQMIDPELAERFELSHYYRVTLDQENSNYDVEVLARRVPDAWPLDTPMDEPAAADALFLKLGEQGDSPHPPLIFAAGSFAWYPEKANPAVGLGPDQLKLIGLGFDWGLLNETFRKGNGKPIVDVDREPFYQLLDVVQRKDPNELLAPGSEPLEVVPLLAEPAKRHGDIVLVKGIARRIIKVLVDDPDIRARYGIDHYYEIDMRLPLGKTSVRMGKDPTGDENPVYHNSFPAPLIVRQLPPELKEGENLGEQLQTAAVFFKVWSYRSAYTDQFKKLQPAPMFIALRPEETNELRPANWLTDIFVGGAMGTAALVLILVLWWFQRSDRKHRDELAKGGTQGAGAEPNEPPDFSNITTNDGPDFSNLK